MAIKSVTDASLQAVADAIRQKGGTQNQLAFPAGFVDAIGQISGGGGGGGDVGDGNVRFIDYDGTLIAAMTTDEALALAELPDNPEHDGLTAQGWNWSLEDIQIYLANYPSATLIIGQTYETDDMTTRIYITIPPDTPANRRIFPLVLAAMSGSVDIDWGDGNTDTASYWASWAYEHQYMQPGEYVITLTGSVMFAGSSTDSDPTSCIFGARDAEHGYNASRIRKIELGAGVEIGDYAFTGCLALESIVIPSGAYTIGNAAFNKCLSLQALVIPANVSAITDEMCAYCYALSSVSIPSGVMGIGISAFQDCYSLAAVAIPQDVYGIESSTFAGCWALTSVTIPSGVNSIGDYAFDGCGALAGVTIQGNVGSIGDYAFQGCYSIGEYHVKAMSPPALNDEYALCVPQDCTIYVPMGSGYDYQIATGWSSYTINIQEE